MTGLGSSSALAAVTQAESEHCADFLTVKPQQIVGEHAETLSDEEVSTDQPKEQA